MKNLLTLMALSMIVVSVGAMANKKFDNVLSIGSEGDRESVNLRLLDQTDDRSSEILQTRILNFKAEAIKDTKRKSFHSLRNVKDVSDDEVMIIK